MWDGGYGLQEKKIDYRASVIVSNAIVTVGAG